MPKLYRQGKKRRMRKFRMDHIASCDVPAQAGATALILKRGDVPEAAEEDQTSRIIKSPFEDAPPGLLTSSEDGHSHLVWLHGRAGTTSWAKSEGEESGHDHPWMLTADGQLVIGENEGHSHAVDPTMVMQSLMDLMKNRPSIEDIRDEQGLHDAVVSLQFVPEADREAAADQIVKRAQHLEMINTLPENGTVAALLNKAGSTGETEADMPENDVAKKLEAAEDQNKELLKRQERLEAIVKMDADVRKHFDSLDEKAQDEFLALDATAQKVEVAKAVTKAKEEDPVIYESPDGTVFRKSDDPRIVKMARERDEDRKTLAKERAANRQAAFEKRAEDELGNLPGDVAVRAAIVEAIDGIKDENVRKAAHESIQAGNKAMKAAFAKVGRDATPEDSAVADAEAELDRLAKARASEKGEDYYDAYDVVVQENPTLAKRAITGAE